MSSRSKQEADQGKMFNIFKQKQNKLSKEQKREHQRRWALIREVIYPVLLECTSVHDVKRRLESTELAIQHEMTKRVTEFRKQLQNELLGDWMVEALPGKGQVVEQKLINVLGTEKLEVVDELLTNLPRIWDTFVQEEMMNRTPSSLSVKWPE